MANEWLDEIRGHDYVLTPGRYVGAADLDDDGEPFEEKMERLSSDLLSQFDEAIMLSERIRSNLSMIGFA